MRWNLLLVIVVFAMPPVAADTASDDRLAAAHFRQGEAYKNVKLYDDAIDEYRKAYALAPRALLLYNIAATYDVAEDKGHALEYFRKYLEAEPNGRQAQAARVRAAELTRDLRTAKVPASQPLRACDSLTLCTEQCIGKVAASCARAGRFIEAKGTDSDRARAVEFYSEVCEGGEAAACVQAGRLEEEGRGVPRSYGEAMRVYTKGCTLDDPEACGRLGWFYLKGFGVQPNLVRAAEYFRKACDRDDARGCHGLGSLYARGDPMPQDLERAAILLGKACDAKIGSACTQLGELAAAGTPQHPADHDRAVELYSRACSLDDGVACTIAAKLDPAHAAYLIVRACQLKDAFSCDMLQQGLTQVHDVAQLEDACAASAGAVCWRLGDIHLRGAGVVADNTKAARFYDLACEARYPAGCRALASMYLQGNGVARDAARGLSLLVRACTDGSGVSCVEAARLHKQAGNDAAARDDLANACHRGIQDACK
jgi:TPR repeat protein